MMARFMCFMVPFIGIHGRDIIFIKIFSDLMRNPMIVPLKILRGHGVKGGLGVLSIAFHPRQPWIFSAGSDGVINLYQDI